MDMSVDFLKNVGAGVVAAFRTGGVPLTDGIVFEHPPLVGRVRPARVGERLHRTPDGFVGLAAETAHEDGL